MGTKYCKDIFLRMKKDVYIREVGSHCIIKYVSGIFILLLKMFCTSNVLFNQTLYGDCNINLKKGLFDEKECINNGSLYKSFFLLRSRNK